MSDRLKLVYGTYTAEYPEDTPAVWGARLIAPDDLVPNRQDLAALNEDSKQELIAWLNGPGYGNGAIQEARNWLSGNYGVMPQDSTRYIIYEDDEGIIVGSTQGSYGYVYVTAWLKGETLVTVEAPDGKRALSAYPDDNERVVEA